MAAMRRCWWQRQWQGGIDDGGGNGGDVISNEVEVVIMLGRWQQRHQ